MSLRLLDRSKLLTDSNHKKIAYLDYNWQCFRQDKQPEALIEEAFAPYD